MWDGHRVYVGRQKAGKTVLALSHLSSKEGPRIFCDLAADAESQGIVIGGADDVGTCVRALKAGRLLHYRSAGVAYAGKEAAALVRLAQAVSEEMGLPAKQQAVTILIDEAQHIASQGMVQPDVSNAWAQGRHVGTEVWLATPVPQVLDYSLRQTAEHKFCGAIDWSPWMATQWGLEKDDLDGLALYEFWKISGGRKEKVRAW